MASLQGFQVPSLIIDNNISILTGSNVPSGSIPLGNGMNPGSLFLEQLTGLLYTLVTTGSGASTGSWQQLSSANSVSNTTQNLSISTIENLYALIAQLQNQLNSVGSQFYSSTITQTASGLVPVDGVSSTVAKWIVTATDPATNYINSAEILAVYNASLNKATYSVYGQLQTGGAINGLDYNVVYTTSGAISGLVLEVGANDPIDITVTRLIVDSSNVVSTQTLPASSVLINSVLESTISTVNDVVTNVQYSYNSNNQISQIVEVVNGLPRTTEITYTGTGSILTESVTYNGSTTTNTYSYNSNNLVSQITTTYS